MAHVPPATTFLPGMGEHALIAGKNGSGKTAFAVWLMVRIPTTPIVIYDTKTEPKFLALKNNTVVITVDEMLEAYKDESIDYIIVRPPETMLGVPSELDEYLWQQYLRMHYTVAYLDEAGTFHTRSGAAGKGLLSLMARGRSKGITTILSTQRPVRIERSVITEMTKAYLFLMQDKRDRIQLDNLIPDFSTLPLPKPHAFYFWETGLEQATLFEPVKLDKAFETGYYDKPPSEEGTRVDDLDGSSNPPVDSLPTKHIWV